MIAAQAAVLPLPSSVDHTSAVEFVKALPARVEAMRQKSASALVVDASGLEFFDSSALAVLLECRRQALASGQVFSVSGAPVRLMQLAALYGVAALFPAANPAAVG